MRIIFLNVIYLLICFKLIGQTNVSGNVSGTWSKANSPYIINGNVTIPIGQTLTIQSGCKILFPLANNSQLIVQGKLMAVGTLTDSIKFSGTKNTLYQYAGSINFQSGSIGSSLKYVTTDSMGDQINAYSAIRVYDSIGISNSTFKNSLSYNSIKILTASISPTISNCNFIGDANTRTISAFPDCISNVTNNSNVFIDLNGNVITNASWQKQLIGSIIQVNSVTVNASKVLNIQSGCKIVFPYTSAQIIVQGKLNALGTLTDSIKFSGTKSGSYQYAGSINFQAGSYGSSLKYISTDSMGDQINAYSAIRIYDSISISNSTFKNSLSSNSIKILTAAISPAISNCNFIGDANSRTISAFPDCISNVTNNSNVIIDLNGNVTTNASWQKQLSASIIQVNSVTVNASKALNIQSGCKIVFPYTSAQIIVQGKLNALGTLTDSIKFSGTKSGSYQYAGSINFQAGSIGSSLKYIIADSMGDQANTYSAIRIYDSIGISNSTFKNSLSSNLIKILTAGISPTISNCNFLGDANSISISAEPDCISNVANNSNVIIDLNGNVTKNASWQKQSSGSIIQVNSVTINANITLTIKPTSKILFPYKSSQIVVNGSLNAEGNITDSIFFYGTKNGTSNYGGGINLATTSTSIFRYTSFDSLGASSSSPYILKISGNCNISNSIFTNPSSIGVRVENSNIEIINCLFASQNSGSSLVLISDTILPTIKNCQFSGSNSGKTIEGYIWAFTNLVNNTNAIYKITNTSLNYNAILKYIGTNCYYQILSTLTVPTNRILTIEPGVLIDFNTSSAGLSVSGTLRVLGSESSPIELTRLNSSGANYGGTINIGTNGNATLNNCNISRMGSAGSALTLGSNTTSQITSINVSNNANRGITISGSSPIITSSIFVGNQTGVYVTSGKPVFNNCNILGNSSFGINNTSSITTDTVDARNCWWGHPSGPKHTTTNPSGLGNQVSNKVKYNPWASKPVGNLINDIGVTLITTPNSNCNLSNTDSVVIKITNFGNVPQAGFSVAYKINNNTPIVENLGSISVLAGSSINYVFNTKVNLATPNSMYNFKVYTLLVSDSNKLNDTINKVVENYAQLLAPLNLLPANNSTNIDKPVKFSWGAVANAVSYDFFIWLDGAAVPTTPTVTGLTQISYSYPTTSLNYGSTYRWKIRAIRGSCSTESNSQIFTLRNLPDLVVSQIIVPANAISETDIAISWKILNQGLGSTGTKSWVDRVYLSNATQLGAGTDLLLGSYINFSALDSGKSYSTPIYTYKIPQAYQGNYYIIVQTDLYNDLLETNNNNNKLTSSAIAITLTPPPDLQITNFVVNPTTLFSEDTISTKWTVTNLGIGATQVALWSDVIYLSKDSVLDIANSTKLVTKNHSGILAVNAFYKDSIRVTLPANINGTYYLHIKTDQSLNVFENVNENNNTAHSPLLNIILRPTPNLIVSSINNSMDTISPNQTVNISWGTKNIGSIAVLKSFSDNLVFTNTNVYSATATSLISKIQTSTINPSDSIVSNTSVNFPNNLNEGDYYFFVQADSKNQINESLFENDNVSTASSKVYLVLPDLKINTIQAPNAAKSEESISVNYTAINVGKGNILNTSWTDNIYLSTDTLLNTGDVLLGSANNNNILFKNGLYNRQITFNLPQNISGNFYLLVVTDLKSNIKETNELNNIKYLPISITLSPWANLIVSNVNTPINTSAGTNVNISYTVKNNGSVLINNKSWQDDIYLSPTNTLNDANNIKLGTIGQSRTLIASQSYISSGTFTIPKTVTPGTYYIVIATDAQNKIFENNDESDNRSISGSFIISILPNIDLAVTTASLNSSNIVAGQTVQATYTVKNAGTTATLPNSWTDAIYLSNNTIIDASDKLLSSWQIDSSLAPNQVKTYTRTITIPVDAQGTLYLLVQTDINNDQNDILRGNNYLTLNTGVGGGRIVIVQPTPVDLKPLSLITPDEIFAGDDIDVTYTVANVGAGNSFASTWIDNVFLTTSTIATSGYPFSNITINNIIPANTSYTRTTKIKTSASLDGNYFIKLNTNSNNGQYEQSGSGNNIVSNAILIKPQQPCDLTPVDITLPSGSLIAGQQINLQWKVTNIGINPSKNNFTSAVYLSSDTVFDAATDILLGTKLTYPVIFPSQLYNEQLTATLNNVASGKYYVIVIVDILNKEIETDKSNNTICSTVPITIDVKQLQMGIKTTDTLFENKNLYYKIVISNGQLNETMSLKLSSDSGKNASNQLYIKYENAPAANDFDFASTNAFKGNQEIIIPNLKTGTYYILVTGKDEYVLNKQTINLFATIIPFSITNVDANKGGNTGNVTFKISGAKFEANNQVKLRSATKTITASNIWFIDASTMYATLPLTGESLGVYDVMVKKANGDTALLKNGFEIVAGSSGGSLGTSGFTCTIENIGFENNLETTPIYPTTTRPNRIVSIIIAYQNKGNVDIELPKRYIVSLGGAPLNFTQNFSENMNKLLLEFKEQNSPLNILRAGASGFIQVYSVATLPLNFVITE